MISFMKPDFGNHYDVIVIGGALAGLSAALTLIKEGFKVLILEQHNLPGGVATSYVRGGVEIEASLHEMCSIGSISNPLAGRKILNEYGVDVNWIKIPDSYRLLTPSLDVRVRSGDEGDFSKPAEDIAKACGDKDGSIYKKVLDFFSFCLFTHASADEYSERDIPKLEIFAKHRNLMKGLGYTFLDVAKGFGLPQKAIDILSAYWIYLGGPLSDMPFTLYGFILADYIGYGAYIPKNTSYEISLKMLERFLDLGGEAEFSQKVSKVLVKDKKVRGVRLDNGVEISCDNIICGAYPNSVYSKMIEPREEVSKKMIKTVNSMDLGISCFSVNMVLDKDYQELGIKDYATFYSLDEIDTDKLFSSGKEINEWRYLTSVCMNVVNKDASPKGTCVYNITYLPSGESFKDVTVENYQKVKERIVGFFLKKESERLGVDLTKHILEIEVQTPVTISHYVGSYMGTIYGYRHSMDNHSVARQMVKEDFIKGLYFAGSHSPGGDGMSPAIQNGRTAAKTLIKHSRKNKGRKN